MVALDKQLGLITKNRDDPTPKRLFKALTDFFEASGDLEFQPSIWKYIKTPTFKKAIRSLDEITDITKMYVDEAFERIEAENKNRNEEKPENEKSVLEKLVKIDKQIAMVMAMDMLMAGVDTVRRILKCVCWFFVNLFPILLDFFHLYGSFTMFGQKSRKTTKIARGNHAIIAPKGFRIQ